ncbi:helicase-associated domain-containing protein [Paenibacillus hubeiensis]|uniref:helicase-associated domain-containing protein n=1 Tax=Paenibacillus hubeiensis TaxID=3077330 RepID=UPI0031BA77F1
MHFEDTCGTNMVSALPAMEQTVLGAVFCKHAGQPFASVMAAADWAEEGLSRAEAKAAFASLWEKGWIQAVRKAWGECLYYIPAAHLPILAAAFERRIGRALEGVPPFSSNSVSPLQGGGVSPSPHRVGMAVWREGKTNIALDLLHVLAWFGSKGLPLTRKGTLHKKAINQLDRMTSMRPEDVNGLVFQYKHQEVYPRHVAIMLDLLLSLGLIQKNEDVYAISQDRLSSWLDLPWSAMHRKIYGLCADKYAAMNPVMQHVQYRLLLLAPRKDQWFGLRQVLPFIREWRDAAAPHEREHEHAKTVSISVDPGWQPEWDHVFPRILGWLGALAGWGFGEIGQDAAEGIVFRWLVDPHSLLYGTEREDGTQDARLPRIIIQPDFELLVPSEAAPSVHWVAECCAELVHRDRLSVYRLSRESFAKAAHFGTSAEEVIRCLALNAMEELHPHIQLALEEWGGGHPSERLGGALLMKHEVPKADMGVVYGENPVEGGHEKEKSDRIAFRDHLGDGLVESNRGWLRLESVPFRNQKEDILPDLDRVPDVWHNDWRRYHLSTARQIAAQAIEWQTKLVMKMKDELVFVIPEKIHGHESWTLTGWNVSAPDGKVIRENFSPCDWEEMRILVPEM